MNETSKTKLTLLGTEIKPGDSVCLYFDVAKLHTRNSVQVPIYVERAEKDGPVLLFLGGVHGDEIEGVYILKQLFEWLQQSNDIEFPLVSMPILNVDGYRSITRCTRCPGAISQILRTRVLRQMLPLPIGDSTTA